jgi:L-ascorbate metabolism protein UlaG (beta-lactamase superfamily)
MGGGARPAEAGRLVSIEISWAGGRTFAVGYRGIRFYMEPCAAAGAIGDADMLTVGGPESLADSELGPTLAASAKAKVVLPKSASDAAREAGIEYRRMSTTDAALRIEYFKDGEYGRIYGVPAARRDSNGEPQLDWHPTGGFPRLGFMARFGAVTVWHSGLGVAYAELAERLRPYSLNVAIVTIGPGAFTEAEAADLAERIEVPWLIPAASDPSAGSRFVEHMLGHRPTQRFKVFEPGERWVIPAP